MPAKMRRGSFIVALVVALQSLWVPTSDSARAQSDSRTFPETGKTLSGLFLSYWDSHGGLAQQGYPISDEMQEVSDTDGKTYTVQYLERAVFEAHPEKQAPYNVLLSLLGDSFYAQKYPNGAPGQTADSAPDTVSFSETGKHLGGVFRAYWKPRGPCAAGLPNLGRVLGEERHRRQDLYGPVFRACGVRVPPGEPSSQ